MYSRTASREASRGWVANRFYYQIKIPLKDAAIMANCNDRPPAANGYSGLSHDGESKGRRYRSLVRWARLVGRTAEGAAAQRKGY